MTRQEERDMRLKIVKEALFWRRHLHELEKPVLYVEERAMRWYYIGRIKSSLYFIKVIKGIE